LVNEEEKKLSRREMLHKLSPLGRVRHDAAKCTGCGLCARECPTGALSAVSNDSVFRLVFRYGVCVACQSCAKICPEEALTVERLLEPDKLGSESLFFKDEIVKCEECGAPVGPRAMVEKMRSKVRTVRSDLCISCKSRSWYTLIEENPRHA
jgi:electron transport complex protein RnfB